MPWMAAVVAISLPSLPQPTTPMFEKSVFRLFRLLSPYLSIGSVVVFAIGYLLNYVYVLILSDDKKTFSFASSYFMA
jgi:hypothetical protein